MEQNQRICPRCGRPAGDFHFCPSCLAPIDSLSAILTSQAVRAEHTLAASGGDSDSVAGSESATALQVESDRPSAENPTTQPNVAGGEGSELQIHLGGSASVPPPTPRDVARLEDVLTIGPAGVGDSDPAASALELPIRVGPRVSVPPPAPREVARLEDVLTVGPAEDAVQIPPKTVAGSHEAEAVAQVEAVAPDAPVAQATPAPVEEVQEVQPPAPSRQPADRRYVPAYALRAAFWFEQASAFESGSDDEEDEDLPVVAAAPVVESVPPPVGVTDSQVETEAPSGEAPIQTPRNHWLLALCLLGLTALLIVLTGRRPCRCSCKSS
jgi:hypothetical protein